jgi:Fe-S cluster assembly protein SufD
MRDRSEAAAHYRTQFDQSAPPFGSQHAWLGDLRRSAIEDFARSGFPTTRDEAWKYTNLSRLVQLRHRLAPPRRADVETTQLDAMRVAGADQLVFINGYYDEILSRRAPASSGVFVVPIAHALDSHAEQLRSYLEDKLTGTAGVFASLNSAFMNGGAYITLERDCSCDQPLQLIFLATGGDIPLACYPRVIVDAHRGSRSTIIETYLSTDQAGNFSNAVTQIHADQSARVEHYRVQCEGATSFHVAQLFVHPAADSEIVSHTLALGAALARNDIHVCLSEPGARVTLNGLYLPTAKQHIDNHLYIEHAAPNTSSEIFYKGVVNDRARAVFNGKVLVQQDAQQINAHQTNNNLLLSRGAEIDTKPELEIYADDVKCGHGATVGKLDEDALFYLRSRGIAASDAKAALTAAFIEEVLLRLPQSALREQLISLVTEKLAVNSLAQIS